MSSFLRPRQPLFALTRSPRQTSQCYYFSSTSKVCEEEVTKEQEQTENVEVGRPGRSNTHSFEGWIRTEGIKWQYPDSLGPKWLGGKVPFPGNPTFKPPVPLSDKLRTKIYDSYVNNPAANDLHVLSTRYGVSIQRVQAIISLKKLEAQWKKNKPLQTGFLTGMERLLGINIGREQSVVEEIQSANRSEVNEADQSARQASRQDERRRKLSRTFFEPVDEGQEPIVPRLLSEQRERVVTTRAKRISQLSTTVVQNNPSKPPVKFIDVGLRWFDPKDAERRQKESVRRKAIKHGKRSVKSNMATSAAPS